MIDYKIKDIKRSIEMAQKRVEELTLSKVKQLNNANYIEADLIQSQLSGVKGYKRGLERALEILKGE